MRLGSAARAATVGVVSALVIVLSAAAALTGWVSKADASPGSPSGLWFVEMPNDPTSDGGSVSTDLSEQATFASDAKNARLTYQKRSSFTTLFNGIAIKADPATVEAISTLPSVKNVYPVERYSLPPENTLSPQDAFASAMIGADIAQNELGLTGAGVKVGVIDTGIDYNHPDLGGNGVAELDSHSFPTARVPVGYDFVGDAFTGDPSGPSPAPDAYPDDCIGHGTHVAGIIGANGSVTGVAPGVTFGDYKVFGCSGFTTDDLLLAAMERAYTDGMRVINMSIGTALQAWPQAPVPRAVDRLQNRGVVVVSSAGNSGQSGGLYASGGPSVSTRGIGVASFDNTFAMLPAFSVSPDGQLFPYNAAGASGGSGSAPVPTSGTFTLAKTGTTTTTNDACSSLPAGSLTGDVVLIRRGGCSFTQKASNAQQAGAVGVIFYNTTAGLFSPGIGFGVNIPVVAISDLDGATLDGRITADPTTTMTWTNQTAPSPVPTAGTISDFSSFGTAADLSLKPDIGAPGGSIYSTYPLELGGHQTLSGTSMASPQVAGAAALLLQARPHTRANEVRTILQNSAVPADKFGTSNLDDTYRQGAGLLNIPNAILATTRIDPGKLSLGESAEGPVTQTLTVTNRGTSTITYDLSNANALSTGPNTFAPTFLTAVNNVSFAVGGLPATSVTVPAGSSVAVAVTASPDTSLPDRSLYGGYVVFAPEGGGQTYRVPYAGFKGDYQSIQVLTTPPILCKTSGPCTAQPPGATYTFAAGDAPMLNIHLNHQARRLRVDVYRTSDNKRYGTAFDLQYLARNTATGSTGYPWTGMAAKGGLQIQVPNGSYYFVVTITKALGTAADSETWMSPTMTLARP